MQRISASSRFTGETWTIDSCLAGLTASLLCPPLTYWLLSTLPSALIVKKLWDRGVIFQTRNLRVTFTKKSGLCGTWGTSTWKVRPYWAPVPAPSCWNGSGFRLEAVQPRRADIVPMLTCWKRGYIGVHTFFFLLELAYSGRKDEVLL